MISGVAAPRPFIKEGGGGAAADMTHSFPLPDARHTSKLNEFAFREIS